MSDRLTRQEIKRDEIRDTLGLVMRFLTDNAKLIGGLVGALVLIGLLSLAWRGMQASKASKASTSLADAMQVLQAPIDEVSPQPEDADNPTFGDQAARRARAKELFTEVDDRFGSTDAGSIAKVYLGKIALEEGNAAAAREHWDAFLDAQDGHMLAGEVKLNLLKLDLAEGKSEEVARELERMLASNDRPLPEDLLLFELASIREQRGETGDAVATYQRIIDEFPQSPFTQAAQRKANTLSVATADS